MKQRMKLVVSVCLAVLLAIPVVVFATQSNDESAADELGMETYVDYGCECCYDAAYGAMDYYAVSFNEDVFESLYPYREFVMCSSETVSFKLSAAVKAAEAMGLDSFSEENAFGFYESIAFSVVPNLPHSITVYFYFWSNHMDHEYIGSYTIPAHVVAVYNIYSIPSSSMANATGLSGVYVSATNSCTHSRTFGVIAGSPEYTGATSYWCFTRTTTIEIRCRDCNHLVRQDITVTGPGHNFNASIEVGSWVEHSSTCPDGQCTLVIQHRARCGNCSWLGATSTTRTATLCPRMAPLYYSVD